MNDFYLGLFYGTALGSALMGLLLLGGIWFGGLLLRKRARADSWAYRGSEGRLW